MDTAAVLTCDRPAPARAAVLGLALNALRHGRSVEILLFDDSVDEDTRRANRHVLSEAAAHPHVRARYAGPEEKQRYLEILRQRTGIPRDTLEFLLSRADGVFAAGANRNLLLLDTVGRNVVTIDDDVTVATARSPSCAGRARWLSDGRYPNEVWFFEDRQSALAAIGTRDEDVLGALQRWLGVTVRDGAVVRTVRLGQAGIAGDCGVASPALYLALGGGSRARLVESETSFRRAMTSREVLSVAPQTTFAPPFLVMPGALALDNRRVLPPFFPRHRNENAVFALALGACHPEVAAAHLPVALWHLPDTSRRFTAGAAWADGTLFRVCDALAALIREAGSRLPPGNPMTRLQALGDELADRQRQPDATFGLHVRALHQTAVRQRAAGLERLLRAYGHVPVYWAEAVTRHVEQLHAQADMSDALVPAELCHCGVAEANAQMRSMTVLFGRALQTWEQMARGAAALRDEDVRVTTGIV